MTSHTDLTRVVAIYRVHPDHHSAFLGLLARHHPTLVALGLATAEPAVVYGGEEDGGGPIVFEIFEWVDAKAPETAHHTPEVMRIWEAMGTMCEERDGKPKFEFPHVEALTLPADGA